MFRPWILALVGCGGADVAVEPGEIAWGEVDFNAPRPDAGYDVRNLSVTNLGTRGDVVASIIGLDPDRLNVQGRLDAQDPPVLAPIAPEATTTLTIGVWGYQPGEWDTLVEGEFQVVVEDLSLPVRFSYTPVRTFGED